MLKELMEKHNLTQSYLAVLTGYTRASVSLWLKGKRTIPPMVLKQLNNKETISNFKGIRPEKPAKIKKESIYVDVEDPSGLKMRVKRCDLIPLSEFKEAPHFFDAEGIKRYIFPK